MRIVAEIPNPEIKITVFHWNNRYLIKLEAGFFEQTFKLQEYDVATEEDVKKMVTDQFISDALLRFNQMAESLNRSLSELQ
ncbi:MAG: hypothetical protein JST48_13770 [Bacteroidetes bacterium]|nr:hypothetical protein [Bacteroidota bacterium]